ncbi:MAG: DUF4301 family protein [Tannerellaceae bacterium]|jgi:hypothetical protein|nr:DUF4301 family protein [Tannerellaceae bacterium]
MKILLTDVDGLRIGEKGITEDRIGEQVGRFVTGFPAMRVMAPASVEKGICVVNDHDQACLMEAWDGYLLGSRKVVKFVPASGAASRMFKDLYAFIRSGRREPETVAEKVFFDNIGSFAFCHALGEACLRHGAGLEEDLAQGRFRTVASTLVRRPGLNYGRRPKGLLPFHSYPRGERTAAEEHLAEGAMYAKNSLGEVNIHFTVSTEHMRAFKKLIDARKEFFEDKFSVKYNISFSVQKSSTDTIAVDADNNPFRDESGHLVFRPGGHGALIENLNDLDADIVFIKNVDNVTPDSLKHSTIVYKKILAGLLVTLRKKIFEYLAILDGGKYSQKQIEEIIHFVQDKLLIRRNDIKLLEDAELVLYLRHKLHRPLRVCGMVKNESEPGGGPFLALNPDGTISPQIVESAQIDLTDPAQKALADQSAYFNPVDIVCALRDHKGRKYNLTDHVDNNAGFISVKSRSGKELKALELPGLWNGAMSDWNTVFVEVPIQTFTPVKTLNDLLRPEHQ